MKKEKFVQLPQVVPLKTLKLMEIDTICICTIYKKENKTHVVDDDNEKLKGKANTEPRNMTRHLRKKTIMISFTSFVGLERFSEITN